MAQCFFCEMSEHINVTNKNSTTPKREWFEGSSYKGRIRSFYCQKQTVELHPAIGWEGRCLCSLKRPIYAKLISATWFTWLQHQENGCWSIITRTKMPLLVARLKRKIPLWRTLNCLRHGLGRRWKQHHGRNKKQTGHIQGGRKSPFNSFICWHCFVSVPWDGLLHELAKHSCYDKQKIIFSLAFMFPFPYLHNKQDVQQIQQTFAFMFLLEMFKPMLSRLLAKLLLLFLRALSKTCKWVNWRGKPHSPSTDQGTMNLSKEICFS